MIMNGIILVWMLSLQGLGAVKQLQNHPDCGWTPKYPREAIAGGKRIQPNEYSWLASLQYGFGGTFGYCGGSAINSLYVLTAAHCVQGEDVNFYGGLTGVRFGDFSRQPFCDYGSFYCINYLHFGIAEKIVHEYYGRDSYFVPHNDIALLRLSVRIPFNNVLRPVCLPLPDVAESNGTLTVAGWGKTGTLNGIPEKRAVDVPVVTDTSFCEFPHSSRMCAGEPARIVQYVKSSCEGDSGGPLMQEWPKRRMVIEGIVSYITGGQCINPFYVTQYTRVRYYLDWIRDHMSDAVDVDLQTRISIPDQKFPTDCGYTPMYPRESNNKVGANSVNPDEYSWIAYLLYNDIFNFMTCLGSVINSRYVLTSADCVSEREELVGVRLGAYDENGPLCDYTTKDCKIYQDYGIEEIIKHSGFNSSMVLQNNIGLIRVDRPIVFGPKMKPICLPFGDNRIEAPTMDATLVDAGLSRGKSDANTSPYSDLCRGRCEDSYCYCTNQSALGRYVSMHQFAPQRMVLEGICTICMPNFIFNRSGCFYLRVRHFKDWLEQNMKM